MRNRVVVVAVVYTEPEYAETVRCLDDTGLEVVWIGRGGIGSLAAAINKGVTEARVRYAHRWGERLLWVVTNVTFPPELPGRLARLLMLDPEIAILHPAFLECDHEHGRPDGSGVVRLVPFVEFTCPMVRAEVLERFPLDEDMPYFGHDLDFGYRVREEGWAVAVDDGAPAIGHTYIRKVEKPHPVTVKRRALRKGWEKSTEGALRAKYGPQWREVLGWV